MKSDTPQSLTTTMTNQPEWMGNFSWIVAHIEFGIAEALALHVAFRSYGREHSLLFASVVPILAIMPWAIGIAAARKYKHIDGRKLDGEVRRDVSCDISNILIFSYLLFIIAVAVTT